MSPDIMSSFDAGHFAYVAPEIWEAKTAAHFSYASDVFRWRTSIRPITAAHHHHHSCSWPTY
jgi:hypothetical protein